METLTRICRSCKKSFVSRGYPESRQKYCTKKCRCKSYNAQEYARPYPGKSTGTVGAIGELRVCADLLAKGYEVFRAVSPSCSCDLLILKNGTATSIEVRTSYRLKSGKISHPTRNVRADIVAAVLPDEIVYEPPLQARKPLFRRLKLIKISPTALLQPLSR